MIKIGKLWMWVKAQLRAVKLIHDLHMWYWTNVQSPIVNCFCALRVRIRYFMIFNRIKKTFSVRKVRVLFLVHNTSKWKAQSLYEAMDKSGRYEPIMALNFFEKELEKRVPASEKLDADRMFFEKLGNRCANAYDSELDSAIDLLTFKPDIVFYQEPWWVHPQHSILKISRSALCCYMPYSVEYTIDKTEGRGIAQNAHFQPFFQQLMFANFTWCRQQAEYYSSKSKWWQRAGSVLGFGHTIMDQYRFKQSVEGQDYVIYAPHYSVSTATRFPMMRMATFEETGEAILAYAKEHPEYNWIFKPHPGMRRWFLESGYMTGTEVDEYYREWEKVGIVCTDGDYPKLFNNSRMLISDSGSFLLEYVATGMPIVRPVPDDLNVFPSPAAQDIIDSLYETHGVDELVRTLKRVLEHGDDYKKDQRVGAARAAGLIGQHAARDIVKYFDSLFKEKSEA